MWTMYCGNSSKYPVTVTVSASIHAYDTNNQRVRITCSASFNKNTWVQSSGIAFYAACNGQGGSTVSVIGNTHGGTKHSYPNTYSGYQDFIVPIGNDFYDVSWGVDIYSSYDMSLYASTKVNYNSSIRTTDRKLYWNDINAHYPGSNGNPTNTANQGGAKFDVYYSHNGVTYSDYINEPDSSNYGPLYCPYDSYMRVFNVRPLNSTMEIYSVSTGNGSGEKGFSSKSGYYRDAAGNDAWKQYNRGDGHIIQILTRNKRSHLTLNPTGGLVNGSSSPIQLSTSDDLKLIYDSNNWYRVPVATRVGYKFLGWYDKPQGEASASLIWNGSNGYCVKGNYWTASDSSYAAFRGTQDLTAYAHWEIQNVAYIKNENNEWKLSTVYVKDSDNQWKPAIMYVKTEDGWKQSVV